MNKKRSPPLSYDYLDSQRLKETFFSPQDQKQSSQKKVIIILSTVIVGLVITMSIILGNYDFILIARRNNAPQHENISLLHGSARNTLDFIGENKDLMRVRASSLQLTIPPAEECAGIKIDLAQPIDLTNNTLMLYLKKTNAPLKLGVVVRDTKFFSNSLTPLTIELPAQSQPQEEPYVTIPVAFNSTPLQNTRLSKIQQIKLFFYPRQKEQAHDILIKDMLIIPQEDLINKNNIKTQNAAEKIINTVSKFSKEKKEIEVVDIR